MLSGLIYLGITNNDMFKKVEDIFILVLFKLD